MLQNPSRLYHGVVDAESMYHGQKLIWKCEALKTTLKNEERRKREKGRRFFPLVKILQFKLQV
jgi:hypothetical protein